MRTSPGSFGGRHAGRERRKSTHKPTHAPPCPASAAPARPGRAHPPPFFRVLRTAALRLPHPCQNWALWGVQFCPGCCFVIAMRSLQKKKGGDVTPPRIYVLPLNHLSNALRIVPLMSPVRIRASMMDAGSRTVTRPSVNRGRPPRFTFSSWSSFMIVSFLGCGSDYECRAHRGPSRFRDGS